MNKWEADLTLEQLLLPMGRHRLRRDAARRAVLTESTMLERIPVRGRRKMCVRQRILMVVMMSERARHVRVGVVLDGGQCAIGKKGVSR